MASARAVAARLLSDPARAIGRLQRGIGPGAALQIAPFAPGTTNTANVLAKLGAAILASTRQRANEDYARQGTDIERQYRQALIEESLQRAAASRAKASAAPERTYGVQTWEDLPVGHEGPPSPVQVNLTGEQFLAHQARERAAGMAQTRLGQSSERLKQGQARIDLARKRFQAADKVVSTPGVDPANRQTILAANSAVRQAHGRAVSRWVSSDYQNDPEDDPEYLSAQANRIATLKRVYVAQLRSRPESFPAVIRTILADPALAVDEDLRSQLADLDLPADSPILRDPDFRSYFGAR